MTIGIFIKAPICKKHCKSQWIRKVSDLQSIGNQSFFCLFWTVIFNVSLDTQKHQKANQIGPQKSLKSILSWTSKNNKKSLWKKLIFTSKIYSQKAPKLVQNHSRSVLDPTMASPELLGTPHAWFRYHCGIIFMHFNEISIAFGTILKQFRHNFIMFLALFSFLRYQYPRQPKRPLNKQPLLFKVISQQGHCIALQTIHKTQEWNHNDDKYMTHTQMLSHTRWAECA